MSIKILSSSLIFPSSPTIITTVLGSVALTQIFPLNPIVISNLKALPMSSRPLFPLGDKILYSNYSWHKDIGQLKQYPETKGPNSASPELQVFLLFDDLQVRIALEFMLAL